MVASILSILCFHKQPASFAARHLQVFGSRVAKIACSIGNEALEEGILSLEMRILVAPKTKVRALELSYGYNHIFAGGVGSPKPSSNFGFRASPPDPKPYFQSEKERANLNKNKTAKHSKPDSG